MKKCPNSYKKCAKNLVIHVVNVGIANQYVLDVIKYIHILHLDVNILKSKLILEESNILKLIIKHLLLV